MFTSRSLKFKIYFRDHNPPHVHVEGPGAEAIFELRTCACIESHGFSKQALSQIQKEVINRQSELMEAWNDYQK